MVRDNHWKNLLAWQKSHDLVVEIYKTASDFPSNEKYGSSGSSVLPRKEKEYLAPGLKQALSRRARHEEEKTGVRDIIFISPELGAMNKMLSAWGGRTFIITATRRNDKLTSLFSLALRL